MHVEGGVGVFRPFTEMMKGDSSLNDKTMGFIFSIISFEHNKSRIDPSKWVDLGFSVTSGFTP